MTRPHNPESADYERKYRADQTRVPAGEPGGGQFADEGGGGGGGRQGGKQGRLGELSRQHESGDRGPGAVSSGVGDKGGVSYGTWQLSTANHQPRAFLGAEGRRWAGEFGKTHPSTPEFSAKWEAIAAREPDAFEAAQYAYVKRTIYDTAAARIKSMAGLDLEDHSRTLRDVVWSTAVQHGPNREFLVSSIKSIRPRDSERLVDYDSRLIDRIYSERIRNFSRTAPRYRIEHAEALRQLRREFGG